MGLGTDGLLWGWEGPVGSGAPPVCCQPVTCFGILLVPIAPCFRETLFPSWQLTCLSQCVYLW